MIPESIQILAHRFIVVFEDRLQSENHERLLGQCDHNWTTIKLDPMPNQSHQVQTVWHEVLHAIAQQMGITASEDDVDRFSVGIVAVMRQNPELVAVTMEDR